METVYNHIGPVQLGAFIEDNTGFDILTRDHAFVKRQLTLVLANGIRVDLANPEYFEFYNNEAGRKSLNDTPIGESFKAAILSIWGNTTTVPDRQDIPE